MSACKEAGSMGASLSEELSTAAAVDAASVFMGAVVAGSGMSAPTDLSLTPPSSSSEGSSIGESPSYITMD